MLGSDSGQTAPTTPLPTPATSDSTHSTSPMIASVRFDDFMPLTPITMPTIAQRDAHDRQAPRKRADDADHERCDRLILAAAALRLDVLRRVGLRCRRVLAGAGTGRWRVAAGGAGTSGGGGAGGGGAWSQLSDMCPPRIADVTGLYPDWVT